jgi:hypothetical protein
LAGNPSWSNSGNTGNDANGFPIPNNTATDNNATFMTQTLARYGLSVSSPKQTTSAPLNTNPRPTDPAPVTLIESTLDATEGTGNSKISVDSEINCDTYAGNTRSQVSNCVATYGGHIDPSWAVPTDAKTLTAVGAQNLDIDTATQQWAFFQHFTLSGYVP